MNQDEARWLNNTHTRSGAHHTKLSAELRLEKRVEELEKALRFYAYEGGEDSPVLLDDHGEIARAYFSLKESIAEEECRDTEGER